MRMCPCRNRSRVSARNSRGCGSTGNCDSARCGSTSPPATVRCDQSRVAEIRQSEGSSSEVFSHNLTGGNPRFQAMKSLIESHLCPGHKYEIRQHPFRPKQVLRLREVFVEKLAISEIKSVVFFDIGGINLPIKV